jgi:type IV fimbrial biogenesis protein FimT
MANKQKGLTLIELMVTLAVAIVLIAVGIPLFSGVADNNRATAQVNALSSALQLARSEAVKTGNRATVCPKGDTDPADLDCGDQNDWANGWMVYRGPAVSTVDAADLVRTWAAPTGMTITTAVVALTFGNSGQLDGAAATQTLTMRVAGCQTGDPLQRQLTVTPVGQVQSIRGTCP